MHQMHNNRPGLSACVWSEHSKAFARESAHLSVTRNTSRARILRQRPTLTSMLADRAAGVWVCHLVSSSTSSAKSAVRPQPVIQSVPTVRPTSFSHILHSGSVPAKKKSKKTKNRESYIVFETENIEVKTATHSVGSAQWHRRTVAAVVLLILYHCIFYVIYFLLSVRSLHLNFTKFWQVPSIKRHRSCRPRVCGAFKFALCVCVHCACMCANSDLRVQSSPLCGIILDRFSLRWIWL